jgi:hypothetical protein
MSHGHNGRDGDYAQVRLAGSCGVALAEKLPSYVEAVQGWSEQGRLRDEEEARLTDFFFLVSTSLRRDSDGGPDTQRQKVFIELLLRQPLTEWCSPDLLASIAHPAMPTCLLAPAYLPPPPAGESEWGGAALADLKQMHLQRRLKVHRKPMILQRVTG